jgi:hypothetical protein
MESNMRILVLGLMAGMVNLLAHGLVDHSFFLVDLAFTFMLMIALIQAAVSEKQLAGEAAGSGSLAPPGATDPNSNKLRGVSG